MPLSGAAFFVLNLPTGAYLYAQKKFKEAETVKKTGIYEDIAVRTGGDVYIGVVGPVRTGKSTFIKRFMETLVLPGIDSDYVRERARDELPQSGSGRTIMTAEPKFVPEEAVSLELEGSRLSVRLIDCVGYMVEGAAGDMEDGRERMVTTPWFPQEVSLRQAAEKGTEKVIKEHSTIGIVITADGSFSEIPRQAYIPAEERVIGELRELGKPFVVLVNSAQPDKAGDLAREIGEKYGVAAMAVNCLTLSQEDICAILQKVLEEFPVTEYRIFLPQWVDALPSDSPLRAELTERLRRSLEGPESVRDARGAADAFGQEGPFTARVQAVQTGTGQVDLELEAPRELFYETVGAMTGVDVGDDGDLMGLMADYARMRGEYGKVADALASVRQTGYGVVMPSDEEMELREPEVVRRGGRYGVRLKATAPSIHMIMTDVETEVNPAMGGEKTSGDVLSFLLQEYEGDTSKIWESNIFGKSLHDIAADSLCAKIRNMPPETGEKLRGALTRIVNDGAGGLICIIL